MADISMPLVMAKLFLRCYMQVQILELNILLFVEGEIFEKQRQNTQNKDRKTTTNSDIRSFNIPSTVKTL